MDILSLILSFIFGAVVGSFLNVVSLRMNTGMGLGGRSKCMSCGNTLSWKELVPIISFALQRGSCRKCKSRISWQYPLVEFCAGAAFVLIFLIFPPLTPQAALLTLIYILATCILCVIAAYDAQHKIIPDKFVYAFAVVALASQFLGGITWFHVPSVAVLLAGPILAVPFALIWLISGGAWMGLGDAKLALGIGWILGLVGGINSVVISFWIAAIASVAWLMFMKGGFKSKTEVPFGPYLIIGMYMVLLFRVEVIDVRLVYDILVSSI